MINSIEYIGGLSATKCCSNMLNTCREPYVHHTARRVMLSADPAASQLRAALDANRKRSTKWTTDAEIGLLTEFWGRMARRDARAFSFVFNEQQLAGPVRKVFSEQAVKRSSTPRGWPNIISNLVYSPPYTRS